LTAGAVAIHEVLALSDARELPLVEGAVLAGQEHIV
jgi:hypothetical protein